MEHLLKTWPEQFKELRSGKKTFEIRKDDRDYKVNDVLVLKEYDNKKGEYTGHYVRRLVTHVMREYPIFGLKKGFCIMSLQNTPK